MFVSTMTDRHASDERYREESPARVRRRRQVAVPSGTNQIRNNPFRRSDSATRRNDGAVRGMTAAARPVETTSHLTRARVGVTAIFFANGFAIGAWAVAIPLIKALFRLSDATLSLVLFAGGRRRNRRHARRRDSCRRDSEAPDRPLRMTGPIFAVASRRFAAHACGFAGDRAAGDSAPFCSACSISLSTFR